jgi:acyl-CoA synthetase (AMP-forming)/AMP-acid ligase II
MPVSHDAKITAEDRPTVYSLLVEAAMRAPEATAITFLPSMESEPIRLTHGAFLARLHRVARLFRELGVARSDVITLLAPSIPDTVVALWAAEAVGIAHPVNTLLRATDIAAMMRAAGSRVLVALGPEAGSDLWDKAVAAAKATPGLRAIVALGEADPGAGYVHLMSRLPRDDGPLDDPPAPGDNRRAHSYRRHVRCAQVCPAHARKPSLRGARPGSELGLQRGDADREWHAAVPCRRRY